MKNYYTDYKTKVDSKISYKEHYKYNDNFLIEYHYNSLIDSDDNINSEYKIQYINDDTQIADVNYKKNASREILSDVRCKISNNELIDIQNNYYYNPGRIINLFS